MKRLLCSALLLVLLAAPIQAQDVTLGVKGGISLAQTDIENADIGTRTGILAGAFARFGLGGMLALQPEVLFVQKGASESEAGADITFELDYVEIPILIQLRLATPGPLTPVLYAGPFVAFESSCDISGSQDGASVSVPCDSFDELIGTDIDTKSTDFGGVVGGGLDFDLGAIVVGAEARYGFGFVDVNETTGSSVSIKNRGWSLLGSLGFSVL